MKREEVKAIIGGITDEQLDQLMSLNNADIEREKGKLKPKIDSLSAQLEEAKGTIATLEENQGDTAALQAEIDKYKEAEEKRQKEAKEAQEKADRVSRFNAAVGELEFSSDFAKDGVYAKFEAALSDPANKGKGDAEIFSSLTKDVEGIFKSKNPPANMGGVKPTTPTEPTSLAAALRARYDTK